MFEGPLLFDDEFLYISCFKRGWGNSGFYLAKINTSTLEIILISEMYRAIDLIKIENLTIYFYANLEQKEIQEISL